MKKRINTNNYGGLYWNIPDFHEKIQKNISGDWWVKWFVKSKHIIMACVLAIPFNID